MDRWDALTVFVVIVVTVAAVQILAHFVAWGLG